MVNVPFINDTRGPCPEFQYSEEVEQRATGLRDASVRLPRQLGPHTTDRYTLRWQRATDGVEYMVRSAWQAARGPVKPIDFKPVGGTTSTAHFVKDSLQVETFAHNQHRIEVAVEVEV